MSRKQIEKPADRTTGRPYPTSGGNVPGNGLGIVLLIWAVGLCALAAWVLARLVLS